MGLTELSPDTDYKLKITINCADLNSYTCARRVDLTVSLQDNKGIEVFRQKGLTSSINGDALRKTMYNGIILRCEKDGYLPQEKEYNVRMIIDQEEISAFFRLVKEE